MGLGDSGVRVDRGKGGKVVEGQKGGETGRGDQAGSTPPSFDQHSRKYEIFAKCDHTIKQISAFDAIGLALVTPFPEHIGPIVY